MLQSNENARDSGLQVYTQGSFEVLNEMKWKAANVYFSGWPEHNSATYINTHGPPVGLPNVTRRHGDPAALWGENDTCFCFPPVALQITHTGRSAALSLSPGLFCLLFTKSSSHGSQVTLCPFVREFAWGSYHGGT